ncbi:MAG: sulfotransferase [Planctomycetes bacterium]|nr:sulfotransferase [Planctomycetota bacterium]
MDAICNNEPVILIGTQRSGTTWLGRILSNDRDVAYWPEPRHIWTHGNAYRKDDILSAEDATPKIRAWIRRKVERFVRRRGKRRLLEKTPSNCLRLPFVRAVFPEARIVLLIRDGRSVLNSTDRILEAGVPTHRIVQRAMETPLSEWPAYVPRTVSTLKRKIMRQKLSYWGPRPPGWQEWLAVHTPIEVLARQWSATITRAVEDAEGDPGVLKIRYERLVRTPDAEMRRLVEFCRLTDGDALVQRASESARADRADAWRSEVEPAQLESVRSILEPALNRVGYQW